MKWNGLITKHHKSQIRKLWTTSDHWACQLSITCVESFVTFFLTSNLCLCLSNHYRLALVINGHHTWSFQLFDLSMKHNLFQQCLQQEAILKSCLFPSWQISTSCEHPPTGTTSQNWIEKDHSEIMLSDAKMLHNLKQNPHKSSLIKQAFQTKTPLSFYFFIGATKYYSILLFLLPAGSCVWGLGMTKSYRLGKPLPEPVTIWSACMHEFLNSTGVKSLPESTAVKSLNLLIWNSRIHWCQIPESTNMNPG